MQIQSPGQIPHAKIDPLMTRAREMETLFLSEMLAYSGLASKNSTFGGGIGEEQFSSFLREEQARLIVNRGGIGLAEMLYRAMGGAQDG